MIDIRKSFHGVRANNNINLKISVRRNPGPARGKRRRKNHIDEYPLWTLPARCRRDPDQWPNRIAIDSPKASIDHGIGMVHQHFMLIQNQR